MLNYCPAALLSILSVLIGCSASVGPRHSSEARTEDEVISRPPEPAGYREPVRDYDRRDDSRTERLDRIPVDAQPVGQRLVLGDPPDTGLFFQPKSDGRVFVRDETENKIIYSGPLRQDQQFWLNLTRERATVDGHTV